MRRIGQCAFGLGLFGVGIAMILAADLGAAPWDVFHSGVSDLTGIPIGTVIILTGVIVLVSWVPLREQPGLGTILNAVEIGLVVDLVLPHLPDLDQLPLRVAVMCSGIVLIGLGSGSYIGSGLGPGPRDGLMTGIARRGISIRVARTGIEIAVLLLGVALGGAVGVGTAVFALGIGPLVQVFLPYLTLKEPAEPLPADEAPVW